jgi:hypothetical protein
MQIFALFLKQEIHANTHTRGAETWEFQKTPGFLNIE